MSRVDAVRIGIIEFAHALRAFLHGFVGATRLPRERQAARDELTHRANGRGRCC